MSGRNRGRVSTAFAVALATLAGTRPGIAEEGPVAAGTRVRITMARKRLVGRVVAMREDVLVLERGDRKEPLEIPRPEVLGLEVSERPSRRGRGAAIGALVGLGGAVAFGVLAGQDCPAPPAHVDWGSFTETLAANLCFNRAETAVLGGILTVPLGALVGAAIGPGEKWRPVATSGVTFRAGPSRGGGVGVRVAFSF